MGANCKEDEKSSEKKMGENDKLKTMESLRGRLLAERQASKVAKQEAELMGNKLKELENQLKEEVKLRQKAEKKLKFLMKKLESLKNSQILDEFEQWSCSEKYESSSSSSSNQKDPKERESKFHQIQTDSSKFSADSHLNNQFHEEPRNKSSSEDSRTDDNNSSHSFSSSNASKLVEKEVNENADNDEDYVDDSMALVEVNLTAKWEPKAMMNGNVSEVLDALEHAREKLEKSMEMRLYG